MRFLLLTPLRRVVEWWIALQVELHGQYSLARLRGFETYTTRISVARVLSICLLTPLPCLALITFIDCVPLAAPEAGTNANYVHWIRNFFTVLLITYAVMSQFRHTVPGLPFTSMRMAMLAILPSIAGVGLQYALSLVIGFPLPFSLVMGTPIWFVVIVALFALYFGDALRANPQFRIDLSNYMFVFLCQIALTLIYPAYIYGFVSVAPSSQKFYIVLLPILKILLKNWISKFLGDLDDMKPEIVIFNVELFNALYVSCCMQQSSSIITTLIISFVDLVQALLSLRDIVELHDDVLKFMALIPTDHPFHGKTFVQVALCIIDEDPGLSRHPKLRAACTNSGTAVVSLVAKRLPVTSIAQNPALIVPVTATTTTKYEPSPDKNCAFESKERRLEFVVKVTQLLFMSEFIVLIEYAEVIVPIIYSLYVLTVYNLKNRAYYARLADLDAHDLERTVSNVLVYSTIELASFLLMSCTLNHKLGIATFKQLAYVLDKQWRVVQSKLMLWFFYTVQTSLDHFGADYSFKFSWLHK